MRSGKVTRGSKYRVREALVKMREQNSKPNPKPNSESNLVQSNLKLDSKLFFKKKCVFFQYGHCEKGTECAFTHEQRQAENKKARSGMRSAIPCL